MSDKTESVEKKPRVGILRKRDTSSAVSNNSIQHRLAAYRAKANEPKGDSNPPSARSVDDGGSMFLKRNKTIPSKPATAPATAPASPRTRGWARGVTGTVTGPVNSACPSTTTLDSRITATSHSSLSHKPGFIPAYLRNKTGTKNLVTAQLQSNKKQFIHIKKELSDMQNKAIDYYKRYRESLLKFNKLNGTNNAPAIGDLQIVGFKDQLIEATAFTSVPTVEPNLAPKLSFSHLKHITDQTILSDISQQVHDIQVHSFKLLQEFADRLSLINNQMKSAEISAAGDTNLFSVKIQSLFEEIETRILQEEEQQNTRIIGFMTNLKQVMINEEGTPVLVKEGLRDEYENYRKVNERRIFELEVKIKDLEMSKMHEEYKNAELTKTIANDKNNVIELKSALDEIQTKRDDRDNEFERLGLKLKQLELSNKRLEKQQEDKTLEMIAKDKSIVELKIAIKSLQEKVLKYSMQIQTLETKVANSKDEFKGQLDRLTTKYEEEVKSCNALRCHVNDLQLGMGDDCRAVLDENIKLKNNEKMLMKELESLKLSLNDIMYKKMSNERTKTEDNVFRREMERRDEELTRLKTVIIEMKEELIKREILFAQKSREVNDLESRIKQLEKRDKISEFQEEILKLKEMNNQKSKEIEQLQNDLNKTGTSLRLQEESLFMQQRLLKIRTELIHSLQENDDSTKNKISDLNSEVERRTYAVKQLNHEMSSKAEELENLFSTLGAKNLEVKKQDHIIKLLEETHERNQKIRVKLEGKIARLENENMELKRFTKYRT